MAKRKAAGTPRIHSTYGLQNGSKIKVADNSGARIVEIITVAGYRGRLNRYPKASVGDMVIASVKKGSPKMRRTIVRAIVVRQRRPYRRESGEIIQFEDNAVVIVNPQGDPRSNEAKGPIAREAISRWPRIGTIASTVI
ncbi:MAG: 50S ribosomal protein L14 [Candidatus Heimdallarchaeota archaeon]|nr:50S ribosomal protein L14 [Candidatus Heimdallarchaeota archaeon]MDH5646221.1 50S ribosomal protein L14 [Candidatus Heimdallarchaeota archaeon]